MPAPPEIGNTVGKKRIVEVFHKSEPQHPAKANSHVGVTGKVEIDLETVGDDTQPCRQYRGSSLRGCCLPQKTDVICQQYLFPDTAGKAFHTIGKEVSGAIPVLQLLRYRLVADDGTRNQLGKQCHIRAEIDDVFLGPCLAPVDVDGIAHGLKGVEADADRQRQIRLGERRAEQGIDRADQEVTVFEYAQQAKVYTNRHQQRDLCSPLSPVPLCHLSAGVVQCGGKQHQHHIDRLTPCVKQQAEQKQCTVAPFLWDKEIRQQTQRQKAL